VWRLILDWSRSASFCAAGAGHRVLFSGTRRFRPIPAGIGADGTAQFLMISDLHFDPMADAKLVDRLAAADFDRWQAILESSSAKSPSRYGQDSNWPLLRSALEQTKQRENARPGEANWRSLSGRNSLGVLREGLSR
jgi:hypothetical protein